MIDQKDLQRIFQILEISQENKFQQFQQQFIKFYGIEKTDYYKPCFCLINLLQNNLISKEQRFIAIYLLIDSYSIEEFQTQNPFVLDILDFFNGQAENEKHFIYSILFENKLEQIQQCQVNLVVKEYQQYVQFDLMKLKKIEVIYNKLKEREQRYMGLNDIQIRKVVADFSNNSDQYFHPPQESIDYKNITPQELSMDGYQFDILRPIPNQIEINSDEVQWMNPGVVPHVMWNFNKNTNYRSTALDLMKKAYQDSLNNDETKFLLDILNENEDLYEQLGVEPDNINILIKKNVQIATQILFYLQQQDQLKKYYEKLVVLDLSVYSLEVISKLVEQPNGLSQDFLHYFIVNQIKQCEDNKKDKNNQMRLVRLLCAFIKNMIKKKCINLKEMLIELQAFCIDFARIQEANTLFKQLKTLSQK